MPTTRPGRFIPAASAVIDSDDVFDATMHVSSTTFSTRSMSSRFAAMILDDRLDDELRDAHVRQRDDGGDPAERHVRVGAREAAALDLPSRAAAMPRFATSPAPTRVVKLHPMAMQRRDLRDAGAHRAGADDGDDRILGECFAQCQRAHGRPKRALRSLRDAVPNALRRVVGRHPRSRTRPSGLGFARLARVSPGGQRAQRAWGLTPYFPVRRAAAAWRRRTRRPLPYNRRHCRACAASRARRRAASGANCPAEACSASLIAARPRVGACAKCARSFSVAAGSSASSTHCQIRPHCAACSAESFSPRSAGRARARGRQGAQEIRAPASGTSPSLQNAWMKLADFAATTMSQASARLAPAPAATPLPRRRPASSQRAQSSTSGL